MTGRHVQESISDLERRLSIGQIDREGALDLAAAYRLNGRIRDAAEMLQRRLEESEPDWEICRACVECYREAGMMEEAVATLNCWAGRFRDRAEFWMVRGLMLELMDEWEAALREHDLACNIAPHMAEAHYRRGIVLMQLARYDEAREDFLTALRLRPNLVRAQMNLGLIHEAQGNLLRSVSIRRAPTPI
jgi:tetratricopeptide (TPR) repeat protein